MTLAPHGMSWGQIVAEVGGSDPTNPLGQNSKMPGPSYGLPAANCIRGSKLARHRDSMCHPSVCYAKRNRYKTWIPVVVSRQRHLASLRNARWTACFIFILRSRYPTERYFRWHDSGDLQGVWHLRMLADIALALPHVKFWLPTHEPGIVRKFRRQWGIEPGNLIIRVSADRLRRHAAWDGLTSTVHDVYGEPLVHPTHRSYECRAHDRDNACGPCRACWSPNAHHVSYPRTGARGNTINGTGRRSVQLRIVE